jgi:hypothetical protein
MIRMMDSHAYPGCPAKADEPPQDGLVKRLGDDRITLTIDAYTTGKGTTIAEKSWLLESRGEDRWRVSRRLDWEE